MKKLTLIGAIVMASGIVWAHDGKKEACCSKKGTEAKHAKSASCCKKEEKKSCCAHGDTPKGSKNQASATPSNSHVIEPVMMSKDNKATN